MRKVTINENEKTSTNIDKIATFDKLVPGGYVCEITRVENVELNSFGKGDYLKIEFDINDPESRFDKYYEKMYEHLGFWGGSFCRSYKPAAAQFFYHFIRTVQASNPGLLWDFAGENDEHALEGCQIGIVLQREEYQSRDGLIKSRMKVADVKTVDDIRSGNFKIPEPITIPKPAPVTVVTPGAIDTGEQAYSYTAPTFEHNDDIFEV